MLAATFTSSNTTLQMLGDTLKYAAPVASSAGAGIEEVAAMAGLLGNVGIQGSMAGTALRAAFLRLSAPPKAAADALAALGVEVTDLDGNLRPVPELLKELAEATEGLGSAERAEAVKQIFGEEASAGLTELLKQAGSGALDSYLAELRQAQGTAGFRSGAGISLAHQGDRGRDRGADRSKGDSHRRRLCLHLLKGRGAVAGDGLPHSECRTWCC